MRIVRRRGFGLVEGTPPGGEPAPPVPGSAPLVKPSRPSFAVPIVGVAAGAVGGAVGGALLGAYVFKKSNFWATFFGASLGSALAASCGLLLEPEPTTAEGDASRPVASVGGWAFVPSLLAAYGGARTVHDRGKR